jgi:NADPH2:quinone reductase
MRVAAVNPPDGLMAAGKYQVNPTLPFVLGLEGAGIIEEIGSEVSSFAVGDRVMTYAGGGCFAEEVVVHEDRIHKVPVGMNFSESAGFTLGHGTAFHALVDRGSITRGDTVVVLGAGGGLGICAIQLAKALGANVIAVARTVEKQVACLANGADTAAYAAGDDLKEYVLAFTKGVGATLVYDTVGGDQTLSALRGLAPLGRHLVVGYASGSIPQIPANYILLKQVSVIGVSYRQHVQHHPEAAKLSMESLLRRWTRGELRPMIFSAFAFENVKEAMNRLAARDVVGKINLTIQ